MKIKYEYSKICEEEKSRDFELMNIAWGELILSLIGKVYFLKQNI